ncbi:MAG: 4Fe-4S dicluster domain-containing protein [Thermoplasmatota archaeon]
MGTAMIDKKYAEWHGIPREKVDWHPKIDSAKCMGCGLCTITCGRGVYKYDYEKRKANVASPMNCLVGCQTCANLCPMKAISFAENDATREKAQKIVREFRILTKIKEELERRRDELKVQDGSVK